MKVSNPISITVVVILVFIAYSVGVKKGNRNNPGFRTELASSTPSFSTHSCIGRWQAPDGSVLMIYESGNATPSSTYWKGENLEWTQNGNHITLTGWSRSIFACYPYGDLDSGGQTLILDGAQGYSPLTMVRIR